MCFVEIKYPPQKVQKSRPSLRFYARNKQKIINAYKYVNEI